MELGEFELIFFHYVRGNTDKTNDTRKLKKIEHYLRFTEIFRDLIFNILNKIFLVLFADLFWVLV